MIFFHCIFLQTFLRSDEVVFGIHQDSVEIVRHSCDEELVLDITIHPEQDQNNNVQFAVCLREKQDIEEQLNNKTPVKDEVSIALLSSTDFKSNRIAWHC